ncbi:hypothetical protein MHBO_002921 [Bonamia ostreae]|uniref:PSP proline-rich domain-containing protein n=1 Tax=Bonamia ostreae TaxID=126728 RepID=A0ABV2ANZ7_9EUKA
MANKRAAKRKRAKERKRILRKQQNAIKEKLQKQGQNSEPDDADLDYVVEMPSAMKDNETYKQIFEKLDPTKQNRSSEDDKNYPVETVAEGAAERLKAQAELSEEDSDSEDEEEKARLSNKKRKLRDRLTIAQLKQVVDRPDLVELHDPNSPDPTLLVLLKSARNSVPVPAHWCDKRRYLAGKRGVQKVVFQLPKAILDTGISDLRNPGKLATLKQKQRQRMNPKIGRLDVDYQKLHAAFFRNMVKPRMTSHGDIYYLGKENEVRYRKHRPGALSKRLRNALHMMENAPPPYLINMQRFGPPPSYPQLRIPGLNAPIPPGCKYGYGDCQWGKPPVNEVFFLILERLPAVRRPLRREFDVRAGGGEHDGGVSVGRSRRERELRGRIRRRGGEPIRRGGRRARRKRRGRTRRRRGREQRKRRLPENR